MKSIPQAIYIYLYFIWGIVIFFGLILPLMENDSAQHATMALHMAKTDNFSHIIRGGGDYLDKPHLHFWLSALSIKAFGATVWAYRLPAVILTILAAIALYKTGVIYFDRAVGRLSSLIYLTSQSIILSLHDVRTDAVLTATFIIAIYYWSKLILKNKTNAAIGAGFFTAMAFGTKGLVAVGVIGLFFLLYFIQTKQWRKLSTLRFSLAILCFIISSLPFFYAYYLQFGVEGIQFLAYNQILGRYSGSQFGGASSKDYFFFYHTMLWAMLPWSVPVVTALIVSVKDNKSYAWFMAITAIAFMTIMNFSSFKLPHYLNIIIPILAMITANFLVELANSKQYKIRNFISGFQYVLIVLSGILLCILSLYVFPIKKIDSVLIIIFLMVSMLFTYMSLQQDIIRSIVLSCGGFLIINVYLNNGFYPAILEYQSGGRFGQIIQEKNIDKDRVYMLSDEYSWALDWKIQHTIPKKDIEFFKNLEEPVWLMTYKLSSEDLSKYGIKTRTEFMQYQYPITRLKLSFLNPETRLNTLKKSYLIEILPN